MAVKVLLDPDPQGRKRFLLEARVLVHLQHPGVVRVEHLGEEGGFPYLAMSLVEGESLKERVRRGGPLSVEEVSGLMGPLCEALDYCHARGVLHRDLKPDNVLLTPGGRPVLVDFGLAKHDRSQLQVPELAHTRLSVTGELKGTPAYMAPEQAGGEDAAVGPASDVYALGGLLFFLLTGAPPFADSQSRWGLLRRVLEEEAPDLRARAPGVPARIAELCRRALAKDPAHRPQSAQEFWAGLREPLAPKAPAAPGRGRGPLLVGVAGTLLAAGVGLGLALGRRGASPAGAPIPVSPGEELARASGQPSSSPSAAPSPQASARPRPPAPRVGPTELAALRRRFEQALQTQDWGAIRAAAAALRASDPADREAWAAFADACAAEGAEGQALAESRALAAAGELPAGATRSKAYQARLSWGGTPAGGLELAALQPRLGRPEGQLALLSEVLRRPALPATWRAAYLEARAQARAARQAWDSYAADQQTRASLLPAAERAPALLAALAAPQRAARATPAPGDESALLAARALLAGLRAAAARLGPQGNGELLAPALLQQAEALNSVAARRRDQLGVGAYDASCYALAREASELRAELGRAWFLRAVAAVRLGRSQGQAERARLVEDALQSYARCLEQGESTSAVLNGRGNLFEEQGRYADALADFEQALKLEPESSSLAMNAARVRGEIALRRDELALALEEFQTCEGYARGAQLKRARRDQARVWACWAALEERAGRTRAASEHFARALELEDREAQAAEYRRQIERLRR